MTRPTTDPIIRLRDVGVSYRLARQRIPSLKEYAIHWMKGALRYERLRALDGLDLTVARGERLGIVGRNGAGKSTLLKVISGVLRPAEGSVEVHGLLAPILELGTGFDFELTGLENIYLNGLLLGHSQAEVDEKVDEIVAFAELEEFLRTPIRNYSTGMVARLGFSIATAWTPDVLILDEVLAVGDARFLRRCGERLERFREYGTTVLIVSHSPEAIRSACRRCLWLERGRIAADGPVDEVLDRYHRFADEPSPAR